MELYGRDIMWQDENQFYGVNRNLEGLKTGIDLTYYSY